MSSVPLVSPCYSTAVAAAFEDSEVRSVGYGAAAAMRPVLMCWPDCAACPFLVLVLALVKSINHPRPHRSNVQWSNP